MEKSEILRAIIRQGENEDISEYEEILNEENENLVYPDIFSETVSKVFKLAMDGKIDPWKIDILQFKDLFFSEPEPNFEVAGLLISSAWHILYEKSIAMIRGYNSNKISDELTDDYPEIEDSMDDDEVSDFIDLKEPVMHEDKRNVTLIELLDSIKRVYKKSREEKTIKDTSVDINEDILMKSNKEDIEEGINRVQEEIKKYINPFFLEDYWGKTTEERSEFLLYMLFLEKRGRISMEQNEPFGNIIITKLF